MFAEGEQARVRAEPADQAFQVASLGPAGSEVPAGWWLVRSGVLDRLSGGARRQSSSGDGYSRTSVPVAEVPVNGLVLSTYIDSPSALNVTKPSRSHATSVTP